MCSNAAATFNKRLWIIDTCKQSPSIQINWSAYASYWNSESGFNLKRAKKVDKKAMLVMLYLRHVSPKQRDFEHTRVFARDLGNYRTFLKDFCIYIYRHLSPCWVAWFLRKMLFSARNRADLYDHVPFITFSIVKGFLRILQIWDSVL